MERPTNPLTQSWQDLHGLGSIWSRTDLLTCNLTSRVHPIGRADWYFGSRARKMEEIFLNVAFALVRSLQAEHKARRDVSLNSRIEEGNDGIFLLHS